jgi:hypothetical protein
MLYFAAALIFLLGLVHSVLGERYILVRLFRRDHLPKLFGSTAFTTQTLRFAWHLTTVVWWGLAALILLSTRRSLNTQDVLHTIAWIALISGLFPLVFTRGKHLAWLVFFAVALLLFISAGTEPHAMLP